jgi:hypothetical protein
VEGWNRHLADRALDIGAASGSTRAVKIDVGVRLRAKRVRTPGCGAVLDATALKPDPATNLQLALGVELGVLPPYLYALWSIKPGASVAALEAANSIRAVVYEEMLHAGLVGNILRAIGATPRVTAHLMTYPAPLPGHTTRPPYAYDVGLGPLSPATIATFMQIEMPEWSEDPARLKAGGWLTLGAFYREVARQLEGASFMGGRQLPADQNPGAGRMIDVTDLQTALDALETIIDQGEGHKPKRKDPAVQQDDDDHEVAHYYQFEAIAGYLSSGLIDPERDLYAVIDGPEVGMYTPEQRAANDRFNAAYSALLRSLQAMFDSPSPRAFGDPTDQMAKLGQLAAQLRSAGTVPGTSSVAGPTFTFGGP